MQFNVHMNKHHVEQGQLTFFFIILQNSVLMVPEDTCSCNIHPGLRVQHTGTMVYSALKMGSTLHMFLCF